MTAEQVVEIVGNAARQPADRLHLLGLDQLLLELTLLRHVAEQGDSARQSVHVVFQRCGHDRHRGSGDQLVPDEHLGLGRLFAGHRSKQRILLGPNQSLLVVQIKTIDFGPVRGWVGARPLAENLLARRLKTRNLPSWSVATTPSPMPSRIEFRMRLCSRNRSSLFCRASACQDAFSDVA